MQFALAFKFFLKRKLYPVDVHIVLKEYLVTLTTVSLKRPTVLAVLCYNCITVPFKASPLGKMTLASGIPHLTIISCQAQRLSGSIDGSNSVLTESATR